MRNNKLTVIVVPNFERKVRRFRTTKTTIWLVLIAIICALGALYLWREWTKQIYDEKVVRLADQLTDEWRSHNDAISEKNETIEALQQKIIQLTKQTEEVRSKLAELRQLESTLISLTGVNLYDTNSEANRDEEMITQEAEARSMQAAGGEFIPADEEGVMDLATQTGASLSQLSASLSQMSDKLEALIEEIRHLQYLSSITPSIWPTSGGRISSGYGYRIDPFTRRSAFHSGIDIEGDLNDDVYATAAGIVAETGYSSTLGNYIIIDHSLGIRTLYGHLKKILVDENTRVDKGDRIGLMGSTGRSTGPHLHYEVHKSGEPVDPTPYLQD